MQEPKSPEAETDAPEVPEVKKPDPVEVTVRESLAQWIPGTSAPAKLATLREWCSEYAESKYRHVAGFTFSFEDPAEAAAFDKAWNSPRTNH